MVRWGLPDSGDAALPPCSPGGGGGPPGGGGGPPGGGGGPPGGGGGPPGGGGGPPGGGGGPPGGGGTLPGRGGGGGGPPAVAAEGLSISRGSWSSSSHKSVKSKELTRRGSLRILVGA